MAKKFKKFPAKALIIIKSVTSAFMFSVYAKDEGISDVKEITGIVLPPRVFMAYTAIIDEVWYNNHKNHRNIKIGNYEELEKQVEMPYKNFI